MHGRLSQILQLCGLVTRKHRHLPGQWTWRRLCGSFINDLKNLSDTIGLELACVESRLCSPRMRFSMVLIHLFYNKALFGDEKYIAFNWKSLAKGSVVVDVGGGLGTASLPLARDFPGIQVVVQDLPGVIVEAKQVKKTAPTASEVNWSLWSCV